MDGFSRFDATGFEDPEVLVAFLVVALASLLRPHLIPLLARRRPDLGLTRREAEVLAGVADGKTNAEIAARLSIAPGTVKKHLDHIYEKLGVGSRTEAAMKAIARPSPPA